ncbi:MAG TPA: hypothetical protein VD905_05465 [Flavobacteriales bacterium]|nr:hypothetical protein [Flavobacteriales bacterium]
MKPIFTLSVLFATNCYGQLNLKRAEDSLQKYRISQYDYMTGFKGHKGYGAPVILTNDGGAAAWGHGDNGAGLVKLDSSGHKKWERLFTPQFTELELQSVVQDNEGNYFACMLSYDEKRYRGGSERLVCMDQTGKIIWDKTLGNYTEMNNPVIQYMHALKDGRIEMRGHIVKDKPAGGKDPVYKEWQGWIDVKGTYTQKVGEAIDWSKGTWKDFYKVEEEKK